MKKILITILALSFCAGAFGQNYFEKNENARNNKYSSLDRKGAMALGAGVYYGTEIENVGLGFQFDYYLTNAFRLTPNATVWFKKDNLSSWDINFDVNYIIPLAQRWKVYPIAGLTLSSWKRHSVGDIESDTKTKFGVNLGAGIEYDITSNWFLNFEFKYRIISDYDQAAMGVGFGYRF